MKLNGSKILITGGAGFIGSHLVDCLMEEGCHIRVIDNLVNGKRDNLIKHKNNKRFDFILGDINDASALGSAVSDIDIVFHLACLGVRHSIKNIFENHRVNAEGALNVLQKAHNEGVKKFIYCSSSEVYGTAKYVPMTEAHPTNPCTVYGASKLAGEAYARVYHKTYGMNTVIVRPFNVYGPRSHHEGDAGEVIPKSIVRALNNEPVLIFGNGSQTRDFTYVEDTAHALVEAAKCDNVIGLTLNVGSDFEIAIKEAAQLILKMTGSSSKIDIIESRPGDVMRLYADSTLFRKITNWRPAIKFEEGLNKTIQWFKTRPEQLSVLLDQENGINWK